MKTSKRNEIILSMGYETEKSKDLDNQDVYYPVFKGWWNEKQAKKEKHETKVAEIDCAFCGKTHIHGWSNGHRIPHCGSQYVHDRYKEVYKHGYIVKLMD